MKKILLSIAMIFVLVGAAGAQMNDAQLSKLNDHINQLFGSKTGQGLGTKQFPAASSSFIGVKKLSQAEAYRLICPPAAGDNCNACWIYDKDKTQEKIQFVLTDSENKTEVTFVFKKSKVGKR